MSKIVLIDDDHDDHVLFSSALHEVAPQVEFEYFDSGIDAVREICELRCHPDLIFLDINMPAMDGVVVAKKLSKVYSSLIPVVVYSTTISDIHRNAFAGLGITKFQTKPTSYEELVELIAKYVKALK